MESQGPINPHTLTVINRIGKGGVRERSKKKKKERRKVERKRRRGKKRRIRGRSLSKQRMEVSLASLMYSLYQV